MSAPNHPGAIDVNGSPYLRDAKGSLVPLSAVKPADLLMDETVRSILEDARAVSKLIDRLESKGMVSKSILLADRRQHSIELTTEGEALVPVLAEMADQNDEEFFGKLPRQLRDDLLEAMKEVARTHQLKNAPLN